MHAQTLMYLLDNLSNKDDKDYGQECNVCALRYIYVIVMAKRKGVIYVYWR